MRATLLSRPKQPLECRDWPEPAVGAGDLLIRVHACGVCRTDLHIIDGELTQPKLPLIPGHEVVGTVIAVGSAVDRNRISQRVGVPWLGWTCGECEYCQTGRENLCPFAKFTGYTRDGGYAEQIAADARYCFPIPAGLDDVHAAPLLCAGLIGYRAFRFVGEAQRIGFYGFGAAAHILVQVAHALDRQVYAFTRANDRAGQGFAQELGAVWAGSSDQKAPVPLDAAIIFAPVGALVPVALQAVRDGGTVVCAGIHMSDIPTFPYSVLWGERTLRSVANLTRSDAHDFMKLLETIPVHTEVEVFELSAANEAVQRFRTGAVRGAAVLVP